MKWYFVVTMDNGEPFVQYTKDEAKAQNYKRMGYDVYEGVPLGS